MNEERHTVGAEHPAREFALVCVECQSISRPGAMGWRIYLDLEQDLATYCPWCAAREFDD